MRTSVRCCKDQKEGAGEGGGGQKRKKGCLAFQLEYIYKIVQMV